MVSLQSELVLEQNDGAKLGGVVLDVEAVLLALDDCVASTHGNIVDPHLTLVASTELELSLLWCHLEQVDVPRGVLVQRHGLQQDVVAVGLSGDLIGLIDNLVDGGTNLESVWVHLFAYLTFESLPVERSDILVLSTWWLLLLLGEHPRLQALEVDETDGASALAGDDEWVRSVILVTPADPALNLVLARIINILGALDLHGLPQFLLVQFFLRHLDVVASEVLDSKSNTTKLDGVEFLDLVVIFAVLVLE